MDPGDQSTTAPTTVDFVALAAGSMVSRYQIVSTLGQGSFGITYRARDISALGGWRAYLKSLA